MVGCSSSALFHPRNSGLAFRRSRASTSGPTLCIAVGLSEVIASDIDASRVLAVER